MRCNCNKLHNCIHISPKARPTYIGNALKATYPQHNEKAYLVFNNFLLSFYNHMIILLIFGSTKIFMQQTTTKIIIVYNVEQ